MKENSEHNVSRSKEVLPYHLNVYSARLEKSKQALILMMWGLGLKKAA